MELHELSTATADAHRTAAAASALRDRLRHKTPVGDPGREQDIARMLDDIDAAAKPLRSMIGKLLWEPQPEDADAAARAAMAQLGYERKQLKKMRAKT